MREIIEWLWGNVYCLHALIVCRKVPIVFILTAFLLYSSSNFKKICTEIKKTCSYGVSEIITYFKNLVFFRFEFIQIVENSMIYIRVLSENVRYLTCHVKENRLRKNKKSSKNIWERNLRKSVTSPWVSVGRGNIFWRILTPTLQTVHQQQAAAIQSRFSVSCVASSGSYPVDIFSRLRGL